MLNIRRNAWLPVGLGLVVSASVADPAFAQYRSRFGSDPATGEKYHVEISVGYWNPEPEMVISSEQLGIPGSDIDFVTDLGIEKERFGDFRLILRPARKHKFRVSYLPMKYEAESVLSRTLVFNGIAYQVGLPVQSTFEWKAWRFGYEWDFIYRDRGFVGLLLEAKYTDVRADLVSAVASEFVEAKAPIPAIGGIARGYLLSNLAITGEVTGFKLPGSVVERDNDSGSYLDFDIYATLNFTHNLGVQGGYRRIDVDYVIDEDFGDFNLEGWYFSGVLRF
ncbi:MAG: hypothetical protein KJ061_20810 [Vicinamibacteraceae bacterium]|nr:hypothetical protein [Vicinamibacteraceae bacterium]